MTEHLLKPSNQAMINQFNYTEDEVLPISKEFGTHLQLCPAPARRIKFDVFVIAFLSI